MPSRKKRQKTRHGELGNALSQAEIWDDSALIRSWNDTVAEYDYYHSIHARGEDVDEVLRKAEMGALDEEAGNEGGIDGGWRPMGSQAGTTAPANGTDIVGDGAADEARQVDGEGEEDGEILDEDDTAQVQEQLLLDQRRKEAIQQCEFHNKIEAPRTPC